MSKICVNGQLVDSISVKNYLSGDVQSSLVLAFPHSGEQYPDNFGYDPELPYEIVDHPSDKYVDQLYVARHRLGIASIRANFPRAYIDVNRHQHDIDEAMLADEGTWYGRLSPTGVKTGTTLFWSRTKEVYALYNRKLPHQELKKRIASCFIPYHQGLSQIIESIRQRCGHVYIVDCHSMTQYDTAVRGGNQRPQVDVGDRYGQSCSAEFRNCVADSFSDQGFDVVINGRFSGGETVLRYGWPEIEQHILQVEIRRDLYMNEESREKLDRFDAVQEKCGQALSIIKSFVNQQMR